MENIQRGLFIVFEGIDGSGTSTHVHRLSQKIEDLDKYQDILRTHEPWRNKEIKRKLQEDKNAYSNPEETAQLFVADRVDHSYRLIETNLAAGVFVISSRYKMSTCAFQYAQGVPLDTLIKMHEYRGILTPDITFLLDIPREIAADRIKDRKKLEKFEREPEFVEDVIKNYREFVSLSEKNPNLFGKVIKIDGNRSIEEVSEEVYQKFLGIYNIWSSTKANY